MKINLHTKMLADFSTVELALERQRIKAREAAEAEKTAKINKEVERLHSLPHFQRGTTTEFVIDLNKDLLDLDQIHQVIISFAQNGFKKAVKREMLYFSDNLRLDKKGRLTIDRTESLTDDGFEWYVDSEGEIDIKHTHHHIRNPKFTYDKVLNHLVLSFGQKDTLGFESTEIAYDDDGYPYANGDKHSVVTMEVKIMTTNDIGGDIITHYQRFYVYDALFEEDDLIYRVPRSRVYVGGYAGDGEYRIEDERCTADHNQLPKRVELLFGKGESVFDSDCETGVCRHLTKERLLREGITADVKSVFDRDNDEVVKYACVAVPIHLKVRLDTERGIEVVYADHSTLGGARSETDHLVWTERTVMVPAEKRERQTMNYGSTYMVDPDGRTPENPSGEFILWYTDCMFAGEYKLRFNFTELGGK